MLSPLSQLLLAALLALAACAGGSGGLVEGTEFGGEASAEAGRHPKSRTEEASSRHLAGEASRSGVGELRTGLLSLGASARGQGAAEALGLRSGFAPLDGPPLATLGASLRKERGAQELAERVLAASEAFLGAPYRFSPLGEGSGVDPDPRWRSDAFDCLTLVESAIALGYTPEAREAQRVLDDLRYLDANAPHFQSRLHLMEAQWIPTLVQKGYLRDVSRTLGGEATLEVELALSEERWAGRGLLRQLDWRQEWEGSHRLPVIPLEAASRIGPSLPAGLILNVVRQPQAGRVSFITHLGLVVEKEGQRFVRHAALRERKVIDEPIEAFLRRHGWMRRWEVLGINLLALQDNSERVHALLQLPGAGALAEEAGAP